MLWKQHEKQVLDGFAPNSLMPSLICGMALGELRAFLEEHLWEEEPDALAQLLSAGGSFVMLVWVLALYCATPIVDPVTAAGARNALGHGHLPESA